MALEAVLETTTTAVPSLTVAQLQSALATTLDSFWTTSPYTAAALACGLKASAADMVAQSQARKDPAWEEDETSFLPFSSRQEAQPQPQPQPTDYKRNAAFLLYGSLYQGMTQEFVYNHLYPVWFGTDTSVPTVLTKVAFDLTCQTTLVTLPVAYLIKATVFGETPQTGLQKYWQDIRHQQLLQKYALLWGPVQCLTFGVVPEAYRVTFIACVSFFWLIILSGISSGTAGSTETSGTTKTSS